MAAHRTGFIDYQNQRSCAQMMLRGLHYYWHNPGDGAALVTPKPATLVATHHRQRSSLSDVLNQGALNCGYELIAPDIVENDRVVAMKIACKFPPAQYYGGWLEACPTHHTGQIISVAR